MSSSFKLVGKAEQGGAEADGRECNPGLCAAAPIHQTGAVSDDTMMLMMMLMMMLASIFAPVIFPPGGNMSL